MKLTKKLFVLGLLLFASFAFAACNETTTNVVTTQGTTTTAAPTTTEAILPVFSGVDAVAIDMYSDFDPLDGVSASDPQDGDLTSSITVVGASEVDTTVAGDYVVVYIVQDRDGHQVTASRTVTVQILDSQEYPLANYLSGVDLSKLSAEDKGILFAAAERYLLEHVYAGVPLYTRASRVMYSSRTQLYSPTYNGVLGFGTDFSQFSADDSTVKMYGDTYGNAGEYTWRASYNTDPTSLNPWVVDDSSTSDFISRFSGALYDFYFDESKTGYEILPSLAASEPIPLDPVVINGKTYATTWQIPLRDDLQWKFHPDTDTSGFAAGFEKLDASDYLWTWKTALDNNWFRAISGGGDFISQGIKNVESYVNGAVTWDQVGLRLAADKENTIELEYTNAKSLFEIKYGFAGAVLNPICPELYAAVGGETGYGLGPDTVAASGIYYLDTWTNGQLLLYKKNDLHPDADMYHFTGYQFRYIDGSDQIFQEFLDGRLESAAVPSAQVAAYANDPRVKVAPDATTWRLMINSFGTEANRDAYIASHPDVGLSEDFVPEPILMYEEMRQALFYGFNRQYAAVDLVKTYLPAATLFTSTYFLDGESGLSVRGFPAGQAIVDDFSGDSFGFYPDAAKDLFVAAVTKGIADGYYTAGTSDNYTTIELVLTYASSGNTGAQAIVAELESEYEQYLVDDTNFVNIDIVVNDVAFPNNYYDYMMVANTDLGIGGISGSLLDAPSFLDVFCDDNRGGFTLNWGIDTSTANIPVAYHNLDGKMVYETWSFNAIVEALTTKVYIKDGVEQKAWTNERDLIDAYLDMSGELFGRSSDGTVIAEYILGDTLENIINDEGFDELDAQVVVSASGTSYLYLISKEGSNYEMYTQLSLFTTPGAAIMDHSGYADYYVGSTGPLTDSEIAANAYLGTGEGGLGYSTIAEIATDAGSPLEYTEIYAVDWNGWSDGYVVLHIGDYYIGWLWL